MEYAIEIISRIIPNPAVLKFVWARERCTWRYDSDIGEHVHAKRMYKVRRLGYDLDRVLVIDDSPEKWRDAYGNLLRVQPFWGTPDDELRRLELYVSKLRDDQNIRRLDKRRWFEQHLQT
jgi:carboxy-terminal domain RNA polymerase II polypeptide A small phosphatase